MLFRTLTFFLSTTLFCTLGHSAIKIEITQRNAAHIFEIMDNVSQWWPDFNNQEYADYWKESGKSKADDKKLFDQYALIRRTYYKDVDQAERDPLKNRNGFFSTSGSLEADPLAIAFYSSSILEEALQKLQKVVEPKELKFLQEFYLHFESRYLPWVQEGAAFASLIEKTQKQIAPQGIEDYLSKLAKFFGVSEELNYQVLFVWWPPVSNTQANPTGDYLILKHNPKKHADADSADIVMHEIVHTVATRQKLKTKTAFTEAFLKTCPAHHHLRKLEILEEPLAVALGQMLFTERFYPSQFSYAAKWYNNPWNSLFGKLIYPLAKSYFERGSTLDDAFIKQAAFLCSESLATAKKLDVK